LSAGAAARTSRLLARFQLTLAAATDEQRQLTARVRRLLHRSQSSHLARRRHTTGPGQRQQRGSAGTHTYRAGNPDRPARRQAHRTSATASSPIWRSGCQGVGVDGHCLVGGAWLRCGCGLRGGPGVRGFATGGHAHIRGLSQDLCSSHVRCLKSSAAAGWAGAQATNRGVVVREPGMLGPPRQPQRELSGISASS
jgi:hypothetical protein